MMQKIHTIFSTPKNKEKSEDNEDTKPSSSNGENEKIDSRNMESWKKKCIPPKLDQNGVETLFQTFLNDLKEEDYKECIQIFRKQKISGKTLVEASEKEELLKDMKKALDFPFEYKRCFDKMVDFIRERQQELKESINEDGSENNKALSKSEDNTSKKRKLPESTDTKKSVGAEVYHSKRSKGSYKNIKVQERESVGTSAGLVVDASDDTEVNIDGITVGTIN